MTSIKSAVGAATADATAPAVGFPSGGVDPILDPNNPDLVAMYTMDNISGSTLVDESANSNDGTITGATQVAGKIDNCLDIDAGDYVYLDTSIGSGNQGAISCWVYPETTAGNHRILYVSDNLDVVNADFIGLAVNSSLKPSITYLSTSVGAADDVCTQNAWNHVVIQSDGSTWTMYINGTESNVTMSAGSNTGGWFGDVSGVTHAAIGRLVRQSGISETQPMRVDQFRAFNRVLTQAEITTLANEV